jgi:hypothetical protein
MVRYRLRKAGLDEVKDIFADDALEIIHRFSRGSPRTVIALADLSLLVGFTNQSTKITFKEVSKAINTMSGKGDTLPFVRSDRKDERGPSFASLANLDRGTEIGRVYDEDRDGHVRAAEGLQQWIMRYGEYARPALAVLVVIVVIIFGVVGVRYVFSPKKASEAVQTTTKEAVSEPAKATREPEERKAPRDLLPEKTESPAKETVTVPDQQKQVEIRLTPRDLAAKREPRTPRTESSGPVREAVINKLAANIRTRPDMDAPRFAMLFQGETVRILDETSDDKGQLWYKIPVLGRREGWVSESVVTLKQ